MFNKQDYDNECIKHWDMREIVNSDPNRLHYHIMPPTGWINDPNGLCQLDGINHIYFQYTPFHAGWGIKSWGHYTTKNWVEYKEEEPFIFPDTKDDRNGAYSGSAIVEGKDIHFFYTGNVKLMDKEYDYIMNGREQNTIHIVSRDGQTFNEKTTVLTNSDYPQDMTKHVRDPKIYKKNGLFYMVLGARNISDEGCVLVYKSKDLMSWEYSFQIKPEVPLGYMWECPDLFEVDGQTILAICPQGLDAKENKYQNVFQDGYIPINFLGEEELYHLGEFKEFDYGFDFYASQTFEDESGRRILIAWMGMPDESGYRNDATVDYGWIHALTMPRELQYINGAIYQKPLEEMKALRGEEYSSLVSEFDGWISLDSCFELAISFQEPVDNMIIQLREDVTLTYKDGVLVFNLGESGAGRRVRRATVNQLTSLRIFSDTSSIEIFVNDGRFTMTSRVYSDYLNHMVKIISNQDGEIKLYPLNSFKYE